MVHLVKVLDVAIQLAMNDILGFLWEWAEIDLRDGYKIVSTILVTCDNERRRKSENRKPDEEEPK